MRLLLTAAALTLFAVAGCGDSTGPGDVSGSWILQAVNADSPPAIVYEDAFYRELGVTLVYERAPMLE